MLDQAILISDASTDPTLKVVGEPFTDDSYGIGADPRRPAAKQFVNAWLQKIYATAPGPKMWKATIGTVVERRRADPAGDRLGRRRS